MLRLGAHRTPAQRHLDLIPQAPAPLADPGVAALAVVQVGGLDLAVAVGAGHIEFLTSINSWKCSLPLYPCTHKVNRTGLAWAQKWQAAQRHSKLFSSCRSLEYRRLNIWQHWSRKGSAFPHRSQRPRARTFLLTSRSRRLRSVFFMRSP